MKLHPVVGYYPGQPPPTEVQLHAAYRLCLNVGAVYQRMIGRTLSVAPAASLEVEGTQPRPTREKADRVRFGPGFNYLYEEARNSLVLSGENPSNEVYAIWILGNQLDGSGRGGPWTNLVWYGDRDVGGVAVMGEKRLNTAVLFPDPPRGQMYRVNDPPRLGNTGVEMRRAVWLATHEVGHALGLEHSFGDPWKESYKERSIMAYGGPEWARGALTHAHHIGLFPHEINWLRGHKMFYGSTEGHMKQLDALEAKLALAGTLPLSLVLGPGALVEELTA